MTGLKRERTRGSRARRGEDPQAEAGSSVSRFRERRCKGKDSHRAAASVRVPPPAMAVYPREGSKGKSRLEQLEFGAS